MKIRIYKIEQIDETKSKIIQQNSNWKKKKVLKLIEFQHLTLCFLYPEPDSDRHHQYSPKIT
jgi:hypothetical protein